MRTGLIVLGIAIAAVQGVDIVLHAATNQLEPLRVSSNVVVLAWLAAVAWSKFDARTPRVAALFIGAYVVLNGIFLAVEGVLNDGQPRTAMFLLVFLTVTLSGLLVYFLKRGNV